MNKVYCIGELLIDFVAEKQGNDLSKANKFTKKAGGAPANVACAIAKLGGKSAFVGCVGEDPFGSFLVHVLEGNSVDVSLVQRSRTFTTLAFVSLADDGERDFVFSRGADKELEYDTSLKTDLKTNMLHLGAATALLGGNLEKAYGRYFFDALTQEAFISFDPNFRADLWKDQEANFIRKCMPFIEKAQLCKFSLEEAQLLSGKENMHEACDQLHNIGAQLITVTLGEKGTLVSSGEYKRIIPSIPVTAVDTTGAGDAFIGCLLQQIAAMEQPHNIMENPVLFDAMVTHANRAGAITTTNFGAIPALPERDMVFMS